MYWICLGIRSCLHHGAASGGSKGVWNCNFILIMRIPTIVTFPQQKLLDIFIVIFIRDIFSIKVKSTAFFKRFRRNVEEPTEELGTTEPSVSADNATSELGMT